MGAIVWGLQGDLAAISSDPYFSVAGCGESLLALELQSGNSTMQIRLEVCGVSLGGHLRLGACKGCANLTRFLLP